MEVFKKVHSCFSNKSESGDLSSPQVDPLEENIELAEKNYPIDETNETFMDKSIDPGSEIFRLDAEPS